MQFYYGIFNLKNIEYEIWTYIDLKSNKSYISDLYIDDYHFKILVNKNKLTILNKYHENKKILCSCFGNSNIIDIFDIFDIFGQININNLDKIIGLTFELEINIDDNHKFENNPISENGEIIISGVQISNVSTFYKPSFFVLSNREIP